MFTDPKYDDPPAEIATLYIVFIILTSLDCNEYSEIDLLIFVISYRFRNLQK